MQPFNGTAEYGEAWCRFGCAVRELDPTGKFRGDSVIWDWAGLDVSPTGACCLRAAATPRNSLGPVVQEPAIRPPSRGNRFPIFGSFA